MLFASTLSRIIHSRSYPAQAPRRTTTMVSPAPMLTEATIAAGPNADIMARKRLSDQGWAYTPSRGGTVTLSIC